MMNAAASVPTGGVSATRFEPTPLLLLDGVPEPRLAVGELRIAGPLDERSAVLSVSSRGPTGIEHAARERWLHAEAVVTVPLRLADEQVRHAVLLRGRVEQITSGLSADRDQQTFELREDWNALLQRTSFQSWWQTPAGVVFDEVRPAVMGVGAHSNRSSSRWTIGGQEVHVFQEDGDPWTVATAVQTLSAMAELGLSTELLPSDIGDSPLLEPIDLNQPIGSALSRLLRAHGLIVQRDLARRGAQVTEHRAIRPADKGRPVLLTWAQDGSHAGHALRIDAERPATRSRPWIARAAGWTVESTFDLVPAWDPDLAGEPDTAYSRTDNPAFATYADVFRLWALNEDGRFSVPPFSQGPAFDLTAFFGQSGVRPRPLRLLPALTLDEAGSRRSPFVEMSADAGQTWSAYPGPAVVRTDRAAVYLDDATLPAAFLAAAQAGDARVRVTASLQSHVPVEALRWQGNPFSRTAEPYVLDVADAFQFKRVDPSSIHYDTIATGEQMADQADQTRELHTWLVRRMQRLAHLIPGDQGKATLELVGVWPTVRVGDRVSNTLGRGVDLDGRDESIVRRGAVVSSVRCRWSAPGNAAGSVVACTTLTLTY